MNKTLQDYQQALEQKRQKAAEYLRAQGKHRADVNCRHRYETCPYTPPPPRIEVGRSVQPQPELEI